MLFQEVRTLPCFQGKKILFTLLLSSLCVFSLEAQGKKGDSKKPAMPARPPSVVGVKAAVSTPDILLRNYVGLVVSPAVVQITPRVSGEIISVGFQDGSQVKEGQVLYKLDPVQYEAAVKSCEAKIAECKAKYAYAKSSFERNDLLYKKNAASRDAMENAKASMDGYLAALMSAEAELIKAKDNLKNTVITAPISGLAGVTAFTKGNYITPSSGTLVSIIQITPMRVKFAMSSADILDLFKDKKDMLNATEVTVTLANGKKNAEKGKISFFNNEANKKTDALLLYAVFPNKDYTLYPGMTVRVTIRRDLKISLPAVLPSAVLHDNKGSYVYILGKDNIVEKRYIVPGTARADLQLIASGLKAGDKVIVKGTHKVYPGAKVIPVMEK